MIAILTNTPHVVGWFTILVLITTAVVVTVVVVVLVVVVVAATSAITITTLFTPFLVSMVCRITSHACAWRC